MIAGEATPVAPAHADLAIARRLRDGDEAAFTAFASAHHGPMVRFAAGRLGPRRAIAEEAAQEAWVVFLERLEGYEGRSSLRTFLFGILVNVLRNRSRAEARSVPLSSVAREDEGEDAPAVPEDRFLAASETWAGHWSASPPAWRGDPAELRETRELLAAAIDALPSAQREVTMLRDVLGWTSEEACNALGISDTHQRVLLHRARAKLRSALEEHLGEQG